MRRGLPAHAFDGRPHIAIANTASDLTPCNAHLDEVAESVKQGIWEAGGRPAEPAGRVARRDPGPADRDAVAQHGRDGDRGDAARQPDRRRGAARRLRQDHPVAADGRRLGRPAGRRRARRPDADRHLPRRARSAAAPTCGGSARRCAPGTLSRGGVPAVGVVDDPQPGPLQHHGHRLDHGLRRRGARHDRSPASPAPRPPDSRLLESAHATGRLAVELVDGGPPPEHRS